MKKILMMFFGLTVFTSIVYAGDVPDSYQVEVSPSTFSVNQSVDMTIKAIKNNEVMKNYVGPVFIEVVGNVEGRKIGFSDYIVPNDGFGNFTLTDQGVTTYSKGLRVSKPGNFTVVVSNIDSDAEISGATSIIVKSENLTAVKNISILSPVAGVEESSSTVDVMANAPELPNARMQIFVNDLAVEEGTSDANGLLAKSVSGLKVGTNYVQVKALSIAGEVVGLSDKVIFVYKPQSDDLLKGITARPNQDLKIGDKVHFEVFTEEGVSSGKLIFTGGKEYPLDKQKAGLFAKDVLLTMTGDVEISAALSAGAGMVKKYDDILALSVKDNIKIGEVKVAVYPDLPGALQLTRSVEGGESENYAIKYGLGKDDLLGLLTTTGTEAILSGFTYGKNYYFQVFSITNDQVPDGLPSEIVEFTMPIVSGEPIQKQPLSGEVLIEKTPEYPVAPKLPKCIVKNIRVSTEKIGNKYYLVWKNIDNVKSYKIYKSDFADNSDKVFLGETEIPRFEYPFDRTLEKDVYAYYTVEALCKDGEKLVIADVKKVQVGPIEDALLIISSTAFLYLLYRLYNYNT